MTFKDLEKGLFRDIHGLVYCKLSAPLLKQDENSSKVNAVMITSGIPYEFKDDDQIIEW